MNPRFGWLLFFVLISVLLRVDSRCPRTCDVALGSYFVETGNNLTFISQMFGSTPDIIFSYNKGTIPNRDNVLSGGRINIPFSCDCVRDTFLGHTFQYTINRQDTYTKIANTSYSGLTTVDMLQKFNTFNPLLLPPNGILNVVVNCSCGDPDVSEAYGLFVTYPLRSDDSWDKLQKDTNISKSLLQKYNPGVSFSTGNFIFIPGKGEFLFVV